MACTLCFALSLYVIALGTPALPWCANPAFSWWSPGPGPTSISGVFAEVARGSPAQHAGLKAGDRIDFRENPFRERWLLRVVALGDCVPVGTQFYFRIHRGTQALAISFAPQPRDAVWGHWYEWVGGVGIFWGLFFASVLASRRPDLKQARLLSLFLIAFYGMVEPSNVVPQWPAIDFVIATTVHVLHNAGSAALAVIVGSTFGRPLSPIRRVMTALVLGLSLLGAIYYVSLYVCIYLLAVPVDWLRNIPASALLLFASLVCLVVGAIATRGAERQRAFWITASIAPVWFLYAASAAVPDLVSTNVGAVVGQIEYVSWVWMPVGLTYAIISRRCIDVGYVINRAAVFATLSIIVLGAFVVVEWLLGTWVSSASRTTSTIINVGVALALGLSIRFVHRRVERVVDLALFRKRHEDETALRRFAQEAPFITNVDTLLERIEQVVTCHAEATDARIFIDDNANGFIMPKTNGAVVRVDENDPAVLTMRTLHGLVDLHRYETALEGELAFPMSSRGKLLGILVCGAKQNGEAYAPDESSALMALAQAVGSALDPLLNKNGEVQTQILNELQVLSSNLAAISTNVLDLTRIVQRIRDDSVPPEAPR